MYKKRDIIYGKYIHILEILLYLTTFPPHMQIEGGKMCYHRMGHRKKFSLHHKLLIELRYLRKITGKYNY